MREINSSYSNEFKPENLPVDNQSNTHKTQNNNSISLFGHKVSVGSNEKNSQLISKIVSSKSLLVVDTPSKNHSKAIIENKRNDSATLNYAIIISKKIATETHPLSVQAQVDDFNQLLQEVENIPSFANFQNIQSEIVNKQTLSTASAKLSSFQKEILMDVTTSKTDKLVEKEFNKPKVKSQTWQNFQHINQGKAKHVWKNLAPQNIKYAYFTPVKNLFGKIFNTKEKEIRDEVNTVKNIQKNLNLTAKKEVSSNESNLALDLIELPDNEKINGNYTVRTEIANRGDLENVVNKSPFKFPQSATIGLQIANGMLSLQKAGYVHGDIKLENVLVYEDKDTNPVKTHVKISDFGKTKSMDDQSDAMHTGNPRFAAPEGRLSQKSEVYGTALMIIRTLEGELLKDNTKDMLINPTLVDNKVDANKRSGIEKFLVLNKDCPQTEVNKLAGKIKVYGREARLAAGQSVATNDLKKAQVEVYRYIDALVTNLTEKNPESNAQIYQLGLLLKLMTNSDPFVRPSMQNVVETYQRILA